MLLALELLLVGELATGAEHAILRQQMRGVGAGRRGSGRRRAVGSPGAARGFGDLQAGRQAFQIALLFGLEITGHRASPPSRQVLHSARTWPRATSGAGVAADRGL